MTSAKSMSFPFERAVDYTDAGQLLGHLVMEVELVDQKIATIPDFPTELALLVKHLLVSHHGAYEFGSPKLPQTVEAVMLHSLDDLDGKIQAIQNLPAKGAGLEMDGSFTAPTAGVSIAAIPAKMAASRSTASRISLKLLIEVRCREELYRRAMDR